MNDKKKLLSPDEQPEENVEEDIYASFNHVEETNVSNDNVNNTSETKEENSNQNTISMQSVEDKHKNDNYLETHTVVTKSSIFSRIVLLGFYLLIILIGVMAFFMFRADRYEFYVVKSEVNLSSGSSYQVELTPKNVRYFDYLNYKYTVDDSSVATVDEFGKVTAVGSGTTKLTISISPGFSSKQVTINCDDSSIDSITLMDSQSDSSDDIKLEVGQTITLKAVINGTVDLITTVEYSSSDESVATVDEFGNVTAVGEGIATITGSRNGVEGSININVNDGSSSSSSSSPSTSKPTTEPKETTPTQTTTKITKITLGTSQIEKYVGDKVTLKPTISPSSASNRTLKWESSDPSVATVSSSGVVTTLKKGTAVITVSGDGQSAKCSIMVKEKTSANNNTPSSTNDKSAPSGTQIKASQINLSTTSLTVSKGQSATFTIKFAGAIGTLSFSSSNPNVATVTTTYPDCTDKLICYFDAALGGSASIDYKVTGVSNGTAYINIVMDDVVDDNGQQITDAGKVGILVK